MLKCTTGIFITDIRTEMNSYFSEIGTELYSSFNKKGTAKNSSFTKIRGEMHYLYYRHMDR